MAILYTGGGGGCHSAPVCICESRLCWLIRHLKHRALMEEDLLNLHLPLNGNHFGGTRSNLVAC